MTEKLRVQGEHYTHKGLWYTSQWLMKSGLAEERGSAHKFVAATLFSFLAFEAYLNAVLEELHPDVWREERTYCSRAPHQGTVGKYRYLAEKAHLQIDSGRRPFQTVAELGRIRDYLAHARVERFDVLIPASKIDESQPIPLRLDRASDPNFVKIALADVEAVADSLQAALVAQSGGIIAGSLVGAFAGVDNSWSAGLPEVH